MLKNHQLLYFNLLGNFVEDIGVEPITYASQANVLAIKTNPPFV